MCDATPVYTIMLVSLAYAAMSATFGLALELQLVDLNLDAGLAGHLD